jgi:ABC-2 type transport system ATP-binding protein
MGQIIARGTLKELRKISDAKDLITVKLAGSDCDTVARIKSENPSIVYDFHTNTIKVECDNIVRDIPAIINRIQNSGGVIERIHTRGTSLESIYLKLTGKELRD